MQPPCFGIAVQLNQWYCHLLDPRI